MQFDENRTLIREGTRGREFFVVVEGVLRVTRNGRQVSVLSAGDFVGELALVTDVPRTATVIASTPVHLLVLTHRGFLDLLEQSPSIAVKVLQNLGERLHSDASSTNRDPSQSRQPTSSSSLAGQRASTHERRPACPGSLAADPRGT